jgi:hypothetical protein
MLLVHLRREHIAILPLFINSLNMMVVGKMILVSLVSNLLICILKGEYEGIEKWGW